MVHRFLIVIIMLVAASCFADDDRPTATSIASLAGTWVTNQGMLELSANDDSISGTLDIKTELLGTISSDTISLQYKRSSRTTDVTLNLDDGGRWLSGEATTGNSKSPWFGCRQIAPELNDTEPADFSGHWLLSWGIAQLKQTNREIEGRYGADKYGQIEGQIEGQITGQRLNLRWRRHRSKGKAWIEQSPGGKHLIGQTIETDKPSTVIGTRADGYNHDSQPVAGETVRGIVDNGMLYQLRMPDDWQPGQETDVVVLLHGSNFTTAGMVAVVARQWPDLSKRFAILGIQGERWTKWSTAKDLRFNYSYVNWMGRSTYRGYPATDRESPSLVMDVIDELTRQHTFRRVFVGGHSQGGFLTYILHMHFPEKLAGTFPIAGGLPIQSDPAAFDDQPLIESQRKTPMVIVHGSRDRVVRESSSTYAHQRFLGHDFHLVKRLQPDAGHAFDFLPVGETIRWLATVSTSNPAELKDFAAKQVENKSWRDVGAAVKRARTLGVVGQLRETIAALEKAAEVDAATHLQAIKSNTDGDWIDAYIHWQDQFSASAATKPVTIAFSVLSERHTKEARRLETEAKKALRERKSEVGWMKYREIIETCYAAPQYRTLKYRVVKHFASETLIK